MRFINYIKAFVALVILTNFTLLNAQNNQPSDKDLDGFFNYQLKEYNLSAISSTIINGNNISWINAYGYKDIEKGTKVDSNTLFHQGSVSKTITLAAFLYLREKNNITLDDDINKYLPFSIHNPFHIDTPITFRMLITHTSSLNDVSLSQRKNKMSSLNNNTDSADSIEEVLKAILCPDGKYYSEDNFLKGEPGTEYSYSNLAYSILGLIIEHISGEPFYKYVKKNMFTPLEMYKSTFLLSEVDTNNFAYQYTLDREDPSKRIRATPYTWAGYMDGSLRTTAKEYSNFLIMLMNKGSYKGKQILAEATINDMLQLQKLPGEQSARMFKPLGRALLWNKVEAEGIEMYHFNGFGSGFFTEVFFSPEKKIAGLFFITGQYQSFPMMGKSISEIMKTLLTKAK